MVKRKKTHQVLNLGLYFKKRRKNTSVAAGVGDPDPDPGCFAPSPQNCSPPSEREEGAESFDPSDAYKSQEGWAENEDDGDELQILTEDGLLAFKLKLEKAMEGYMARLRTQSRPAQYNKFNSQKRTTLQSRKKRAAKHRAAARAAGYPPIHTFFCPVSADKLGAQDDIVIVESYGRKDMTFGAENKAVEDPPENSGPFSQEPGAEDMETDVESARSNDDALRAVSDCSSKRWENPSAAEEDSPLVPPAVNPQATWLEIPSGRTERSQMDDSRQVEVREGPVNKSTLGVMEAGAVDDRRDEQTATAAAAAATPSPLSGPAIVRSPALRKGSMELSTVVAELEMIARKKATDVRLRARVVVMLAFLRYYASESLQKSWIEASELAAIGAGKGSYFGRQLRSWVTQYVASKTLPLLPPVQFKRSMVDDEDLKNDIKMHLQAQGKWVKAAHIVEFLQQEEVKQKYGLTKAVSERTARRWMHEMAYRYGRERNGQYVDGHEREDVVEYRKNVFLKRWDEFESRMLLHDGEGKVVQVPKLPNFPHTLRVEQVAHDESTFYAHDQRKTRWIPEGESPIPAKKGEGISLMASDFCSPSFGWLRSPDGSREARLLFRAGKNRDGWFDSEDILQQTDLAIDLFEENFPLGNVIGLFCFDNAPSHQKRAPDALSARRMPKGTKFWPEKVPDNYVRMRAGKLPNGAQQDFWYPDDHPSKELAGKFKGMKIILKERGRWPNTTPEPKAECDGFNCPPGRTDCCTRRLLWSESDFANQKSALQELVEARGHLFLFYPKYHCELNFIEQCWGKAKYEYRMYTMPKTEVELERNVRMALDSVTVPMMRRFSNRSARFMDAYRKGLSGAEAAWANKKYRGHRVLPYNVILEIQNGL